MIPMARVEKATGIKNWSGYQLAVFDAVLNTNKNIVVQATAGSGKTTVLVAIANLIDPALDSRFLAFNKIIADELQERLPSHFPASTIHSFGFSQLRRSGIKFKVDNSGYKLSNICSAAARCLPFPNAEQQELAENEFRQLINMVRLTRTEVTDPDAMWQLAQERGLVYEEEYTRAYAAIMEVLAYVSTSKRVRKILSPFANKMLDVLDTMWYGNTVIPAGVGWIDFTDMVQLPLEWGLVKPEHDVIAWDESQDGNQLYFDFIRAALKPTGRLIAVGDDKQNIMGFAGAFLNGMDTIKTSLNATELPLSYSYRCPKTHIQLANEVFPGTKSPENAIEGQITKTGDGEFIKTVKTLYDSGGSILIMCRKNAPTIRLAVKLLQMRIPAKIKGRTDVCAGITAIIRKCAYSGKQLKKGFNFDKFEDYLYDQYKREYQRLIDKNAGELAQQTLEDKYQSIQILYETSNAQTVEALIDDINGLFSDGAERITLSSIHKCKGTEANVTAILEADKLPLVWANQTESQHHAELCVQFVAYTRSKQTMYLVSAEV